MRRFLIFLFALQCIYAQEDTLRGIYHSMNKDSLSQLLAFSELYPQANYSKQAQQLFFANINKHRDSPLSISYSFLFSNLSFTPLMDVILRPNRSDQDSVDPMQDLLIKQVSNHLKNRTLKGSSITKIEQIQSLQDDEVDLARALFLHEFSEDLAQVNHYESLLDLMALQILSYLPKGYSTNEAISKINYFIFHEMKYRFPPHSLWAQDVDSYTILPAVMDSRHGVCLGVSILYLSLAQRLGITLVPKTPPGHIYLNNPEENDRNIETTARGIHLPEKHYLGMNTKQVPSRTIKEVIGLSFMNQAAVAWEKEDYHKACSLYTQAIEYLPNYFLAYQFLTLNLLFDHQINAALEAYHKLMSLVNDVNIANEPFLEDYILGNVDIEGLKTLFLPVDETKTSVEKKKKQLEETLIRCPHFRSGYFHLAVTNLQLGKKNLALNHLLSYHRLDSTNPTVEYLIAMLYIDAQRHLEAVAYIDQFHHLTGNYSHCAKVVKEMRFEVIFNHPHLYLP